MAEKPKIIAVVGPTASGKSALGIALAKKFGGEIVSADSRQIYRGMDIGTAKPTSAERHAVPHHLIDIKNPDEDYTVADYQRDAFAVINDIIARGNVPLLIGGTGLYVRAVLENLDIPKTVANPELRAQIEKDIAEVGLLSVFKRLETLDPEAISVVDPKNPRRVVRALEVALTTGKPFTAQRTKRTPIFDRLVLGLAPAPDILRERINQRVDEMIRNGLVREITILMEKYGDATSAFDAIGYREIMVHLNGTLSLDDATTAIKINTWHYAKRQMTWFKKHTPTDWMENKDATFDRVEHFL